MYNGCSNPEAFPRSDRKAVSGHLLAVELLHRKDVTSQTIGVNAKAIEHNARLARNGCAAVAQDARSALKELLALDDDRIDMFGAPDVVFGPDVSSGS